MRTPQRTLESLLDANFDITDDVINVATNYKKITWDTQIAMMDRKFQKINDAFIKAKLPEPPVHINTGFGKNHIDRFLIDFVASQTIDKVQDHTAQKLIDAFYEAWPDAPDIDFKITIMGNSIAIYIAQVSRRTTTKILNIHLHK